MNRRILIAFVLLCAAGGLSFWLLRGTDDAGTGRGTTAKNPAASRGSDSALKSGGPWPEPGTQEFQRVALERGREWLDLRGRDAASLVACWDITGKASLLDEAAQKFPDDPLVCIAMTCRLLTSGQDSMVWIDRLLAAEPTNPIGYYLKATALEMAGATEEAIEILRAAVAVKGKPNNHLRDRILTARAGALASGADPGEAAFAVLAGTIQRGGVANEWRGANEILRKGIREAKSAGNSEWVTELASLGAAVVEHLRMADAPTLADDLISLGFHEAMLKELDPAMEYGSDSKTVGERIAELERQRIATTAFMKEYDQMREALIQPSGVQMAGYADRFLLYGEQAAIKWFKAQKASAQ